MHLRDRLPRLFTLALLCAAIVCAASPASAQTFGIRAGVSADPDQFYFGGHLETRPLVDRLHFRPNVEVGVGNDVTLVAVNFELAYKFRAQRAWTPYAGAGPALNLYYSE